MNNIFKTLFGNEIKSTKKRGTDHLKAPRYDFYLWERSGKSWMTPKPQMDLWIHPATMIIFGINLKYSTMITAIILINTEKNQVNTVGAQLAALEGVDEVYSVSGRYDLIALIRLKNIEDLARLATEQISKIDGITNTESMVAFKKISPGDIAGMFDLGS